MEWSAITDLLAKQSTKLQGIAALQEYIATTPLANEHVSEYAHSLTTVLRDRNIKIYHAGLEALINGAPVVRGKLKPYTVQLVAAVVGRLGDSRHAVRSSACAAIVCLMHVAGPLVVLEKSEELGYWSHKNWRVKHGMLQAVADSISRFGVDSLSKKDRERMIIQPALMLTEDNHNLVRDAAIECLGELHRRVGDNLMDTLRRYDVRASLIQQIQTRFPKPVPSGALEGMAGAQAGSPDKIMAINSSMAHEVQGTGAQRRGGYKDGGGFATPSVPVVHVQSEKELKNELDKILTDLGASIDWNKRLNALLRLEGMLSGSAPSFPSCAELLRPVKDPLTAQINDRRSAVSRQACHVLGVMAASLGSRFELLAVHFLPVLFKVLIITIQVMAEAADVAVQTILYNCQMGRAAQKVCQAVTSDRNAKLRQHCTKYLLQVLETWPPSAYEKILDDVEGALVSAAQDAMSETRSMARAAFAAFHRACPERAKACLKRMDGGLQQKLQQSLAMGKIGGNVAAPPATPFPAPQAITPRENTPAMATPLRQLPSLLPKPAMVDAPWSSLRASAPELSAADGKAPLPAPNTAEPDIPAKGLTLGQAVRLRLERDRKRALDAEKVPSSGFNRPPAPNHRRKMAVASSCPAPQSARPPSERSSPGSMDSKDGSGRHGLPTGSAASVRNLTIPQIVKECPLAREWATKVFLIQSLTDLLLSPSAAADISNFGDRLTVFFVERFEEAHLKVVHAAIVALGTAIETNAGAFAMYMDRLMPPLFQKFADQKEITRKASQKVLEDCAKVYIADTLLPAMVRSIEATKLARVHEAVLEYSCMYIGRNKKAGALSSPGPTRQWICRIALLVEDKNPGVRRLAVAALENVYKCVDPNTLLAHINQASPQEQHTLRRVLMPLLPQLMVAPIKEQHPNSEATAPGVSEPQVPGNVAKHFNARGGNPMGLPAKRGWREPQPTSALECTASKQIVAETDMKGKADGYGRSRTASTSGVEAGCSSAPLSAGDAGMAVQEVSNTVWGPHSGPLAPGGFAKHHQDQHLEAAGQPAGTLDAPSAMETEAMPEDAEMPQVVPGQLSSDQQPVEQPVQLFANDTPRQHRRRACSVPEASPSSFVLKNVHKPVDQREAFQRLVHELQAEPSVSTVQRLGRCACDLNKDVWAETLAQVVLSLLSLLSSEDESMREQALIALREVIVHQASLLPSSLAKEVILHVLACHKDRVGLVRMAADQVMEELCQRVDPGPTVDTLSGALASATETSQTVAGMANAVACCIVNNTARVLRRSSDFAVSKALQTKLMSGLLAAYNSSWVDVRKSVVYCLAELWNRLGERMSPELAALTPAQTALVKLYADKVKHKNKENAKPSSPRPGSLQSLVLASARSTPGAQ